MKAFTHKQTRYATVFNDCKVVDGASHWQIKQGEKLLFTIEKSSPNEPKRWIESRLASGDYNI